MSPMHQAPSMRTLRQSHPKSHLPTAGRSQGWAGRLERKVCFKTSLWMVWGCSEGAQLWWPHTVALAAPMHPLTAHPDKLGGILSGENSCDPCWTWGQHPNFCLYCWHLWAQKRGGVAVSSAGHRETSPKQGPSAQGSWSPPSPHLLSLPPMRAAGTRLGMSPAECHPLQPCTLKDSCSSAWQLETANAITPLYARVSWKWNLFFSL